MKNSLKPSILKWIFILPVIFFFTSAYSQIVLTLTPSQYGAAHNISCFGKNDGYINVTISGGATPYTFRWSNTATTQNLTTLPAGYYSVVATDRNGLTKSAEITLVEPRDLGLSVTPYSYPNGYNISLFGSCNGMVTVTTTDGVPPYTYLWSDGNTNQNRTSMCKGSYALTVTDANNCKINQDMVNMMEPERSDWTMTGNSGTNPATQFIGTSDSTALKFKTNNQERLRINSNGTISIPSLAGGEGMLYVDSNGEISSSRDIPTNPCFGPLKTRWNVQPQILYTCPGIQVGIGTWTIPANYALGVNGKIICEELKVKQYANWPDYIFNKDYKLMPIKELENFLFENKHLPNIPSENEIIKNEGIEIGEMNKKQLEKIEILYLYVIELQKQIDELKKSKN